MENANRTQRFVMDDHQIKSEITANWNQSAITYDSFISHGVLTNDEKKLWIQAFVTVLPRIDGPLQVLDIGCGTGAMGLILAEMGYEVTGMDLSENMMEQGRQKAAGRNLCMQFQSGDAENPPFPENYFDVVVTRHLLWTLPHPDIALSAWMRIIKPGGRIVVIDGLYNDGGWESTIRRSISRTLGEIIDPKSSERLEYSAGLQQKLPHMGGVCEKDAIGYFAQAGLVDIVTENLAGIRRDQHKRLVWYQKIKPVGTYYLISGTKSG